MIEYDVILVHNLDESFTSIMDFKKQINSVLAEYMSEQVTSIKNSMIIGNISVERILTDEECMKIQNILNASMCNALSKTLDGIECIQLRKSSKSCNESCNNSSM